VQQGLWEEIAERARRRLAMLPGATLALLQTEPDGAHYRLILPTAQTRTVLVVEDNPEVGGLFQRYLTSGGYQALLATRGAEAIALARSRRLHAITLDLVMDSADGWDVLQALRDDPRTSYIPIIVCSVLDQQQLALMLGASAFLKKPVLREHLLQALVQVERDRAGYDGEHV
jgi:CheY-like chemotaxis protein